MVKTRQQLADEYGISPRTLSQWLKRDNIIIPSGALYPKTQQLIYSRYGSPRVSEIGRKSQVLS